MLNIHCSCNTHAFHHVVFESGIITIWKYTYKCVNTTPRIRESSNDVNTVNGIHILERWLSNGSTFAIPLCLNTSSDVVFVSVVIILNYFHMANITYFQTSNYLYDRSKVLPKTINANSNSTTVQPYIYKLCTCGIVCNFMSGYMCIVHRRTQIHTHTNTQTDTHSTVCT